MGWGPVAQVRSIVARKAKAREFNAAVRAKAKAWRDGGATLERVAERLNGEGIRTVNGLRWRKANVRRLLVGPA
jgi:hypothetical protein